MKLNSQSGVVAWAAPGARQIGTRLARLAVLAAACALSASAHAAFFNNSTGLANPDQTITFESAVLTNEQVTTQFQEFGVTFSTAFANPDSRSFPNISGNRVGNFRPSIAQGGLFTAQFSGVLSQLAFALVSAPGAATIQAVLGGTVVESVSVPTTFTSEVNFFGFEGMLFDRVTISVNSSDRTFLLDNLQTVAVPEPGTSALLIAGLGLLGARLRRSRR
jgi:PEP-CTERM motif